MRGSRVGLALALLVGAGGCQDNETAIARGDRMWADSAYTSALAEYRLAVAQRGDIFGTVSAVDAALEVRPALRVPESALAAARFYRDRDEPEQALAYYTRALTAVPPDSALPILYEVGLTFEEDGACAEAMEYYRAFRQQAEATRSRRWVSMLGEARWHTGNCAFTLAQQARRESRPSQALDHYTAMIRVGEPENLLDQAYFEQGEIQFALGRFNEALESYRNVIRRNPARTGQLVVRAQERIDEIRFGPGPVQSDTLFR